MRRIVVPLTLATALSVTPLGTTAQVPDQETSVILGRVTERGSGNAIEDASVVLPGLDRERMSDNNGRFELTDVAPGTYVLRVSRIGYDPVTDTLEVPATSQVSVEIQLVTAAVELEPVVVVASYTMSGKMAGFYRRRQASSTGRFLTRADFEDRPVAAVSGMLRHVPGLRVVQTRQGGMSMGNNVVMRGNCHPAIYMDGIRATPGGLTIDEMLAPRDIEGVEIYQGSQTPPEFMPNECGAILFWTRPGGRPDGGLAFWKAALLAGGLGLLSLFLSSL